jgi:phosphoglycerate dehydrogenase-like enzyme
MSTPLLAIIDWAASPLDDSDAAVERAVIGDAARVKRFLCASDADFDEEICDADAIIVWHNTPITAAGLNRLRNCKAIIRNGVGFDSVDVDAAQVCFYDPYLPNGVDKAIGITRAKSLPELLAKADVLSVHCPLNDETHHMIGERELAQLKPSAFVVNTARGGIIEKTAILNALRNGRLAGAGLDVVEDEPLKTPDEAATPNLIVTCHAAFCSVESKNEMRVTSARIALAAVKGSPLENVVNGDGTRLSPAPSLEGTSK